MKLCISLITTFIILLSAGCQHHQQEMQKFYDELDEHFRLKIMSVSPSDGATGVSVTPEINLTFNKDVVLESAKEYIRLKQADTVLEYTMDVTTNLVVLKPTEILMYETTYTLEVADEIIAQDGWIMNYPHKSTFQTQKPPVTIIHTYPKRMEKDIPPGAYISLTFSDALRSSSIADAVLLSAAGLAYKGDLEMIQPNQLRFTPDQDLPTGEMCSLTILTTLQAENGQPFPQEYFSVFFTANEPDSTPPTIRGYIPEQLQDNVPIPTYVAIQFNEGMDPESLKTAFSLEDPAGKSVAGSLYCKGEELIFIPTEHLELETLYTARLTTDATDISGNALEEDFTLSFITSDTYDTTPPVIQTSYPTAGQSDVPGTSNLLITFSEIMDRNSTETAIQLYEGEPGSGEAVPGTISWLGNSIYFQPEEQLKNEKTYSLLIKEKAMDVSGNTLAADTVIWFTIGTIADIPSPEVESSLVSGVSDYGGIIEWVVSKQALGFVQISEDADFSTVANESILGFDTSHTFKQLKPNTTYFYKVRVYDYFGNELEVTDAQKGSFTTLHTVYNTGVFNMSRWE